MSDEKEIAIVPKRDLILEGDPQKQLEYAQKAAKALMDVVSKKAKPVIINKETYLEFPDWQTLGRFFGGTVGTEWTKPIERDGKLWGYEASAIVRREGMVIASAEAMCSRDEEKWGMRPKYEWQGQYPNKRRVKVGEELVPEFQLRSMAQTRAGAKALKNAYGWVARLAGYRDTPAEEMQGIYPEEEFDTTPIKAKAKVISTGDDTQGIAPGVNGKSNTFADETDLMCADCDKKILQAERDYSLKFYGLRLCRTHQKDHPKI